MKRSGHGSDYHYAKYQRSDGSQQHKEYTRRSRSPSPKRHKNDEYTMLFISSIPQNISPDDLEVGLLEEFETYGKVSLMVIEGENRRVRLRFNDPRAAKTAFESTLSRPLLLLNQRVDVKPMTSEKNPSSAKTADLPSESHGNKDLFVGNLPKDIDKNTLLSIFGQFGHIENVKISRNKGSNAFAFLTFVHMSSAIEAVRKMNNSKIGQFHCKVGFGKRSSKKVTKNTLCIRGVISWSDGEIHKRLKDVFSRYGSMEVKTSFKDGVNIGYITYKHEHEAKLALESNKYIRFGDLYIKVSYNSYLSKNTRSRSDIANRDGDVSSRKHRSPSLSDVSCSTLSDLYSDVSEDEKPGDSNNGGSSSKLASGQGVQHSTYNNYPLPPNMANPPSGTAYYSPYWNYAQPGYSGMPQSYAYGTYPATVNSYPYTSSVQFPQAHPSTVSNPHYPSAVGYPYLFPSASYHPPQVESIQSHDQRQPLANEKKSTASPSHVAKSVPTSKAAPVFSRGGINLIDIFKRSMSPTRSFSNTNNLVPVSVSPHKESAQKFNNSSHYEYSAYDSSRARPFHLDK